MRRRHAAGAVAIHAVTGIGGWLHVHGAANAYGKAVKPDKHMGLF